MESITENNHWEIHNPKQILSAVYNSTHSIRLIVAPDYSIQFFNKKANEKAVLTVGKELKIGDNFMGYAKGMLNNIDEGLTNNFKAALQGTHILEEKEVKNASTFSWFKTEYFPLCSGDKPIGVSISIRDITEKKKNELFIKKQNELLKDIIFFESHIVREPVANILGLIQLLEKSQIKGLNKEIFDMLESTTKKLDKITRMIIKKCETSAWL